MPNKNWQSAVPKKSEKPVLFMPRITGNAVSESCLVLSTRFIWTFLLCDYKGVETFSIFDVIVSRVPTDLLCQRSGIFK